MVRLPHKLVERLRGSYADRTVCVTGGAGFIGGHTLDALTSLGARCRVIDDLSNASAAHIAGLIDLDPDSVTFVHGSILDDHALAEAMRGADLVIHLAALGSVPRSMEDPARTWAVNATGTMRVLEAARAARTKRVVFAASSSAYGDAPGFPRVETMMPDPRSPYAASKVAGETLCHAWSAAYGLSTVSLRYFNVFGPRQPAGSAYAAVIPAFAERLLAGEAPVIFGDGEQTRDFTFVASAVAANLLAGAAARDLHGEVVNIGSGTSVTINELAATMARQMDVAHVRPEHRAVRTGDVRDSLADVSAARELFGYEPVADLEQGLADTVRWYRDEHAGRDGTPQDAPRS